MKHYPSIDTYNKNIKIPKEKFYIFDKIDGSQIRAEFSLSKNKFFKFGSKNVLIDSNTPILNESINLINLETKKYSELCKKYKWEKITCFFEFYGENSFAGSHKEEKHNVCLFDICVYKKGFILPKDFIEKTNNFDIEKQKFICYEEISEDFINDVKNSIIPGMTMEGIIAKGSYVSPGMPFMIKIKSYKWLDKVKELFKNDEKKLLELL